MELNEQLRRTLLAFQRNEITEHQIYRRLAGRIKSPENRRVLEQIAEDELQHYQQWREYTQTDVPPDRWSVWKYSLISRLLGFTFGVKLMEMGEDKAQGNYSQVRTAIPEADAIMQEEHDHENALLAMLDEERLRYTGSIVLGLNDALVELTGALAGLTLALQSTRLIALTGSITGIAAALSMAASEYLSTKAESAARNAGKASIYTGITYIVTVAILILPYLVLSNYYVSLACTLAAAVLIIAFFTYYISVAKGEPFKRRFLEMAGLSLSVAAFSFLLGLLMRTLFGVDI
jgi:VIT1/CCC1 family predicted Fe2+/Mn2+ transporter